MCKQRPSVDVVRQMCWLCWVNRLWVVSGWKGPREGFLLPHRPASAFLSGGERGEGSGEGEEAFPVQWTGGLWFVFPQTSQNTGQVCSCLALWGPQGRQTYDVKGFLLLLLFGFSVLTWTLAAPPDQREEWSLPGFGLMDRQWVEKSKSKGDGM